MDIYESNLLALEEKELSRSDKKRFYVNNADFYRALMEWNLLNHEDQKPWWRRSKKATEEYKSFLEQRLVYRTETVDNETKEEKRIRHNRFAKTNEALGKMILNMIEGQICRGSFYGYRDNWKSDMRSEAWTNAFNYMNRYDIRKGNPFAYYTQIIIQSIRKVLNDNKDIEHKEVRTGYISNFDSSDNLIVDFD